MRGFTDDREFDELSVDQKIRRLQDLWDRIAQDPGSIAVSDAQRRELERRLRAHETNPARTVSWESLRRRLKRETR